jgi:hypothetical protein
MRYPRHFGDECSHRFATAIGIAPVPSNVSAEGGIAAG